MVCLGRNLKVLLVPPHAPCAPLPPCNPGQGELPLDQVAQSYIQPGLELFQGWGIHISPRQPVSEPHYPHTNFFSLIPELNLPSFSLNPLLFAPLLHALVKSPSLALLWAHLMNCRAALWFPWSPLPAALQLVFIGEGLQPSDHWNVRNEDFKLSWNEVTHKFLPLAIL